MKLYQYLLNVSIITRWILFIVPMLGILWIPGILSLTAYPNANVSPNVLEDSEVILNFIIRYGASNCCGGAFGRQSAGQVCKNRSMATELLVDLSFSFRLVGCLGYLVGLSVTLKFLENTQGRLTIIGESCRPSHDLR